jgi:hypothetical protein
MYDRRITVIRTVTCSTSHQQKRGACTPSDTNKKRANKPIGKAASVFVPKFVVGRAIYSVKFFARVENSRD